jgi:hypothetical protein
MCLGYLRNEIQQLKKDFNGRTSIANSRLIQVCEIIPSVRKNREADSDNIAAIILTRLKVSTK